MTASRHHDPGAPPLPEHPYPGLRAYKRNEWPIFFGRESMTQDVIDRVIVNHLVAVHGDSGCGKSSLIAAGVLPLLEADQARVGGRWHTCITRPGDRPLWNIAEALSVLDRDVGNSTPIALRRIFHQGEEAPLALADALGCCAEQNICILFDQFEELFEYARRGGTLEAEMLIGFLVGLARTKPPGLRAILTMRTEYLGQCAQYQGLAETVNETQYLLPRMEPQALFRAIREPARLYDGCIEENLAWRLIDDAGTGQDQLPLLQHGLRLLWGRDPIRKEREIGLNAYKAAGNLSLSLSNHADAILVQAAASPNDEAVVENVFRALTARNLEGLPIRRQQTFDQLCAVSGANRDRLQSILGPFRAADASFLKPYGKAPLVPNDIVDISHEALIRNWRRISAPAIGWLDREAEDGLIWTTLRLQATSFEHQSDKLLSLAVADERSDWIKGRNEIWSARYGGQWSAVHRLLQASRDSSEAILWARKGRRDVDIRLLISSEESEESNNLEGEFDALEKGVPLPPVTRDYFRQCEIIRHRSRLINCIKGGHVSSAFASIKRLRQLDFLQLLDEQDCGLEPHQLWPAFWEAVTGKNSQEAKGKGKAGRAGSNTSIFIGPEGKSQLRRKASRGLGPLAWAAVAGRYERVRQLVKLGADPQDLMETDDNILASAALGGDLRIVRYLVEECEVDPLREDSEGSKPITWAIQEHHHEVVEYLLTRGESLEFISKHRWNALTEAARADDLDFTRHLIAEGFDPRHRSVDGQTPLHVACVAHRAKTARVAALLTEDDRVDLMAQTDLGWTALHVAAGAGKVAAIEVLMETAKRRGLQSRLLDAKDTFGDSAFIIACTTGQHSAVQALLQYGADPNTPGELGNTPLVEAVSKGHRRTATLLLNSGNAQGTYADPNLFNGWAALHYAAYDGDLDMVERLLKAKVPLDLDIRIAKFGWTALMLACRQNNREIVLRLLAAGADASIESDSGRNALTIAKDPQLIEDLTAWARNRPEMAKRLKRQAERATLGIIGLTNETKEDPTGTSLSSGGVPPSAKEDPNSLEPDLVKAARENDATWMRELLKWDPDPASLAQAIREAVQAGNKLMVEILLNEAKTALNTNELSEIANEAAHNARPAMVKILMDYGAREPQLWRRPQISKLLGFLALSDLGTIGATELRPKLEKLHPFGLGDDPSRWKLRAAPLPFFRNCRILIIEHSENPGQNEQFALIDPQGSITPVDWTNKAIYDVAEEFFDSSSREDLLLYIKFFFMFVRSVFGRFNIVEDAGSYVPWLPGASPTVKAQYEKLLKPLTIKKYHANALTLQGTVVFRNALFSADVKVRLKRTTQKNFPGLVKIENERLLLDELPIETDAAPGLLG